MKNVSDARSVSSWLSSRRNVVHGTPTASTLQVSLSSCWPRQCTWCMPVPAILAPCSPGDVALDLVHGHSVSQGSHGLAWEWLRGDSLPVHLFLKREMVTCCVRSPLHCLYRLGPDWSTLQSFFYGRTTLCHRFL